MIDDNDLKLIASQTSIVQPSAEHVLNGVPIPKPLRVAGFSPEEWESFIEEWANGLENCYAKVRRFGGAGDMGIDVIGFVTESGWNGEWDNYQCKRYDHPLRPSDIWIEIGKTIYYSYKGEYSVPRKYYFVASQGISTSLEKLLARLSKLKEGVKDNWDKHCQGEITSTTSISLDGDLLNWFEKFDFSIFSSKSIVELIDEHAKTPFHSVRFGGGLPPRPIVPPPPIDHDVKESRYIQQLFDAYGDHLGTPINEVTALSSCSKPELSKDFLRQRERFYHAEYLRNYARDTVPAGTFESLQDEMFHGVVDVCEGDHQDGLARMRATISHSATISSTSNPLKSVVKLHDQQGICHQLANEDKLVWVPKKKGSAG